MTQITINVENNSLVPVLKKILSEIKGVTIANSGQKDKTSEFLQKYTGRWQGEETAEEIINNIKAKTSSKNPPILD